VADVQSLDFNGLLFCLLVSELSLYSHLYLNSSRTD
jgi:hypothetical protein